jgi:zinc transport system substrate-binding protein
VVPSIRRLTGVALLLGLVTAGCGGDDARSADNDGKIEVVASFYPIAAAVQQVGGAGVAVTNLTPAGSEPHDLELTSRQVDDIEDADAVFVLGRDFQPAIEDAASQRSDHTVNLLDELNTHTKDPHVWLDPILYERVVDLVERKLAAVDPSHAATYASNAERFKREIHAVDDRYVAGLAACDRRTIVTAHEAFGRLARRYELEQQGVAGVAPDQEPSGRRMAELADLVDREGVTTIFTEELVSPKVAEALAREAGGARTEVLNPLEGLTNDEVAAGYNWVTVMDSNLAKLRTALNCR